MRDPTWFDAALAVFLIAWLGFVVFGGLAALGWWFGGLSSTEPRTPQRHDPDPPPGRSLPREPAGVRRGDYILYDDPDSTAQVLEDEREWHHDRRQAEGHGVCPECGAQLM